MSKFFTIHHQSKKSKARVGEINTSHGTVQTPGFVPVATKASIKAVSPQSAKEVGVQIAFVNTYHLVTHPGVEVLEKTGGVHHYAKLLFTLMSDSGGFQVFSLAKNAKNPVENPSFKPSNRVAKFRGDSTAASFSEKQAEHSQLVSKFDENQALVVKIDENGVVFRSLFDGSLIEFTPEKSMEYQQKIGADIIMAFDECTYYPATEEYARKAMVRTHDWLLRCIKKLDKDERKSAYGYRQYLYGIIQGATYKNLRHESGKFISQQDVDGVAIGGISVGETKAEMRQQVEWVTDYLPTDKPVHLLGIGQLDDIFELITHGVDTFDCVEPTRVARMGKIYQWQKIEQGLEKKDLTDDAIDIMQGKYKSDVSRLDEDCDCSVCQNFTKSYLHHLLKQRELLGYSLASHHNLYIMERLMARLREMINNNQL